MSRFQAVLVVLLLLAVGYPIAEGTNATRRLRQIGRTRPIVTAVGTSAVCSQSDATLAHGVRGKAATAVAAVVSGQAVVVFVRMHETPRGLYVDLVFSDTSANLTTALNSLNITGQSHPSPTKDACDTAVSAATGGE